MLSIEYLAGAFDSEGTIGIHRSTSTGIHRNGKTYAVQIAVTNTYLPLLMEFRDMFGGTVTNRKPTGHGVKRRYDWYLTGQRARTFLITIMPYLLEKRQQAELAIQLPFKNVGAAGRTIEERELQEHIYQEVKRLKHL